MERVKKFRRYTPILLRTQVVKLSIERRYCRTCKQFVEKPVYDVLPRARLSLRVMLIVTWLTIGLRRTEEATPNLFWSLFNIKICEREVPSILSQDAFALARKLKV